MNIHAIKCLSCGDVIYSRARHDFYSCKCGEASIDGGFDYMRIMAEKGYEPIEIDIDVTEEDLYDDWNKGIDKFGHF
jgi:hypothetical protein